MFVDSHSHLFLEGFAEDLPLTMERARAAGVTHILIPNINSAAIEPMLSVCDTYRSFCLPVTGLYPTSVNDSYGKELEIVADHLTTSERFVVAGGIGIDLHWDKTWLKERLTVFKKQVQQALQYQLPITIHCREAFDYTYKVLQPYKSSGLTGIFHSFAGTPEKAVRMIGFSRFKTSIGGVVTFKKLTLSEALEHVPLEHIVLEMDFPHLTPAPSRRKGDESVNVKDILVKVAEIYKEDPEKVVELTATSASKVFGILK